VSIDGQDIASLQDLSAAINSHRAGEQVTMTVFRGRKKLELQVTLSDAKDAPGGQGKVT